ncbi:MAG: FHA domain-containing protein [Labilithrix sp.]|nr:FHA domain-containing protein [Labilithrix sp.]MCW5811894.1 FHA domain-containing protein [Labilithrix sp.]
MWKLVIEDDEGKRTVVPLTRDDYSIGRQEGNTIRLTERNVSRTHGRVRRNRAANGSGSVFVLEDLRSYNGLFVNGLRVAHTQDLQNGDLIQIGDYRIVLQDDAAQATLENATIPITSIDPSDAKATIPIATAYRGQTLTERPNRLVMLVGPTPGVEYPLDRERMTIGRAEDASISVNHNSVSRLHCEVHALGDGRFEIVDKGSSNGVRVNAVELRRSIIEAGDVIELGDVRFKFVGAGQVFVPGPNESQQLTAISDRDVDLNVGPRKGLGAYALPVVGALIIGGGVLAAALIISHRNSNADALDAGAAPVNDTDQQILAEAKQKCTLEDCEQSHVAIAAIPESSPWREQPDFRWIVTTWADSIIRKAKVEPDPDARRNQLNRVIADPKVDPAKRKEAEDLLKSGEATPAPVPVDSAPPSGSTKQPTGHTNVTSGTMNPAPPAPNPQPAAPPAPAPAPKPKESTIDLARAAALRGDHQGVRRLLDPVVKSGHASPDEVNLLKQTCKDQKDKACIEEIKAKYP